MSRIYASVSAMWLIVPVLFVMALPGISAPITATVSAVADGNTITVKCQNGKTEHVSLYGIDAPEVGQLCENISTRALSVMVYGKQITVDEVGRDRWNSIIGYVKLGDQDINAIMVEKGHAWANSEKYKLVQEKAQAVKAGLWGYHGKQVAPWEWIKKGQPDETFERVGSRTTERKKPAIWFIATPGYIKTIGSSRFIAGTIKNTSKKTFSYIKITYDLYDSSGSLLGRTSAGID